MKTGREKSFLEISRILYETYTSPINIVETGCVRGLEEHSRLGDGWSTYHWLNYCKNTNSNLWSIDIDAHAICQAKKLKELYFQQSNINVHFILEDSISILKNFNQKIDLLFLDSYDYCGADDNIKRCHEHQLNEIKSSWDKLNKNCFILLDDVFNDTWDGKGKLSIPYLLNHGFQIKYFLDNQILLYGKS